MKILLTRNKIDVVLPLLTDGLTQYLSLQQDRDLVNIETDRDYQRRFNRFYRVRRGPEWQAHFYKLLEASKGKPVTFGRILESMHAATGRYEASFASKLVATIDPTMPVIDSIVLKNLQLRLPARTSPSRSRHIKELHADLKARLDQFLLSKDGRYLVRAFKKTYPRAAITEMKMLDLVLWQTR